MHTLYLAVEFMDEDDCQRAVAQAYEPDSVLVRQLEMVVQARFGGTLVNPVRDGVILKPEQAQAALYALQVLGGVVRAGSLGEDADPPSLDTIDLATSVLDVALDAIASGDDDV